MGSHSIITCHPLPDLNPSHVGQCLIYLPWRMEGWVDLGVGYIRRRFTCPDSHPSRY